ncbi:MAG: hypothetical protein P4N60_20065 [Verrucomicrobiae bacterium]|nr:hypothetical protein [Verrucomicrobiae bacterium]
MIEPLFIATERFDPSDEAWKKYFEHAKIPALAEVVGLDGSLCNPILVEISDEDWNHIVNADYLLRYFCHLDYLLNRVQSVKRRNILGLYRNPEAHITKPPSTGDFKFMGYELIDEQTHTSALTNCGFSDVFSKEELNSFGLISEFERANEIKSVLAEKHPEDAHAQCDMYAIWRLNE